MRAEIAGEIEEVRKDRTHGAGWLSRRAIDIMKLAAESSQARSSADFLDELAGVVGKLMEARPSMVPIANLVSHFHRQLLERSRVDKEPDSLKRFALQRGDEIISEAAEAARKAAENGAGEIQDGDVVITCSYCSTVCQALRIARGNRKEIEVIACESKSHG